jgi:hypothetical protein
MRELFLSMEHGICITKPSKCTKVRSNRHKVRIISCLRCCYYRIKHKFSFVMPETTFPKNVMSGLFKFSVIRGTVTQWTNIMNMFIFIGPGCFLYVICIYNVFGTCPIKPKPIHVKRCIQMIISKSEFKNTKKKFEFCMKRFNGY